MSWNVIETLSGRVRDSKARERVSSAGTATYIQTESGKVRESQKQSGTVKIYSDESGKVRESQGQSMSLTFRHFRRDQKNGY